MLTRCRRFGTLQTDLIEKGRGHFVHFALHVRKARAKLDQLPRDLCEFEESITSPYLG